MKHLNFHVKDQNDHVVLLNFSLMNFLDTLRDGSYS